jgi:DNA-binding GntR family transcriptional regulator
MTLYEKTIDIIRRYIAEHRLKPGDKLLTEAEFARMAGVSLVTVRRALAELASQGLVRREQGRGTFLQAPRIDVESTRLGSLKETLEGDQPLSTRLVSIVGRVATEDEAKKLQLPLEAAVWEVTRIRLVGDQPLIREVAVIPQNKAPSLPFDLQSSEVSLYKILAERYGIEEGYEKQTLLARHPTNVEREALQLKASDWVIVISGVSYTSSGLPFDAFNMAFVASRFAFHLQTTPANILLPVSR